MKKMLLTICVALTAVSFGANARVITPQDALARMTESKHMRAPHKGAATTLVRTMERGETPTVYLFSVENAGCYVLSADDATEAVLGYTDVAVADGEPMPPQLEGMLEFYSLEIENIRKKPGFAAPVAKATEKASIQPMCSATWGQTNPYNSKCPEVYGSTSLSGCGAVAMAQVMKYFEWPPKGSGIGVARDPENNRYTMPLDVAFDWDNMLDTYSNGVGTDEEKEAVATLMAACGHAAGMIYSPNWSESDIVSISRALVENFNYSRQLAFDRLLYYDYATWCDKIYENLASGSPVIYRGYSRTDGGHIFVCEATTVAISTSIGGGTAHIMVISNCQPLIHIHITVELSMADFRKGSGRYLI